MFSIFSLISYKTNLHWINDVVKTYAKQSATYRQARTSALIGAEEFDEPARGVIYYIFYHLLAMVYSFFRFSIYVIEFF